MAFSCEGRPENERYADRETALIFPRNSHLFGRIIATDDGPHRLCLSGRVKTNVMLTSRRPPNISYVLALLLAACAAGLFTMRASAGTRNAREDAQGSARPSEQPGSWTVRP